MLLQVGMSIFKSCATYGSRGFNLGQVDRQTRTSDTTYMIFVIG